MVEAVPRFVTRSNWLSAVELWSIFVNSVNTVRVLISTSSIGQLFQGTLESDGHSSVFAFALDGIRYFLYSYP